MNTELGNPSIFILPKDVITFSSQPETRKSNEKYLIDYSTQDIYDLFDSYLNKNIGNNVFLKKIGKEGVTNSLGEEQATTTGIIGYASAVESGTDLNSETFAVPTTKALKDDSLPIIRYRIQRKLRNKAGFISQKYGRILITCCTHGLEKMGIPVLINLLESIKLQNNKLILDLLTYFDIDIIPCVNPNGINRCIGKNILELETSARPGRRNARGVNLNRNFQRGWTNLSTNTGNEGYKGPFPLSEQESLALSNIYSDDYCLMLDLHTTSYTGKNFVSQIVTDSWLCQRIYSRTLEQMQTRLVNVYGRDIISDMVANGAGTYIVSSAGNNGFTINDFTDTIGHIDTSAIFEMPKIQNNKDGSKFYYSEESQLYSTEIILTFLYNYYIYVTSQGGRTPREIFEKEKLPIYNMEKNLLSMDPRDWDGASIDTTQTYPGSTYRGIVKKPIKIDKGTRTLLFKNFSPLYTRTGESRQDTWKFYVNYGAGTKDTLPERIYSWTEVKFGESYNIEIAEGYEYVWIYFKVLNSNDEEVDIRTSEIGLTYVFSLKYLLPAAEIDMENFARAKHKYPTLTKSQKTDMKNLMQSYYNNRTLFIYEYNHNMDIFSSKNCYDTENKKFKLNCNTFVENIMMGRSVNDFVGKNETTYSPNITKVFDFGYYPKFVMHEKLYQLAKRDESGAVTDYYGFVQPNPDSYKFSYSQNSYWSQKSEQDGDLYGQNFNSFMNANDLAYELYQMGCEIPLSEIDIGDIVFNKHQADDLTESNTFFHNKICWRKIAHVAMVMDFDAQGYPIFVEANGSSLTILRRGINFVRESDKTYAGFLLRNNVMCARMPIAFGYESNVPSSITVRPKPSI